MRKPITLSIEEELIEKIKIKAIREKTNVSEMMEIWITTLK